MQTESLNVAAREGTGKGAARKLRAAGRLPAVVYRGGLAAMPISLDPSQLEAVFRRTMNRNTVLKLELGGQDHLCLVKDVQRHPVSRRLEHVDLYEVTADEQVRVTVDVEPVGTPEGVRMGGRLQVIRRTLDLLCKPADIPSKVTVNVADLGIGKFVRVSEIEPPSGTSIIYTTDFNVVAVIGKRGGGRESEGAEG